MPSGRVSPSTAASIKARVPGAGGLHMSRRGRAARHAFSRGWGCRGSFSPKDPVPLAFSARTIDGPLGVKESMPIFKKAFPVRNRSRKASSAPRGENTGDDHISPIPAHLADVRHIFDAAARHGPRAAPARCPAGEGYRLGSPRRPPRPSRREHHSSSPRGGRRRRSARPGSSRPGDC